MATAINYPLHLLLDSDYTEKCKSNPETVVREDLPLNEIGYSPTVVGYLLHNIFTPEECERLISETESLGYSQALIHFGDEAVLAPGYRDSKRVMIDSREFADIIFSRIGHLLPAEFNYQSDGVFRLKEINERMRFLRYDEGDKFAMHYDGEGGETTLLAERCLDNLEEEMNLKNRLPVRPTAGSVLVFEHNILHEGSIVVGSSSCKYTIRTDVLYG